MYRILLTISICLTASTGLSRNISDPVYLEPFDRAAGGTVLTRATRDGIILGNPALLGLGKDWIRWAGLQMIFQPAGDLDKLNSAMDSANGSGDTGEESEESSAIDLSILDLLDLGFSTEISLSMLSQNGGGMFFGDGGLYLNYDEFGNTGIPGAQGVIDILGGVAISGAFNPVRWLHLGATQKVLQGKETNLVLTPLNYESALAEAQDMGSLGQGTGTDVGALIFFQDYTIDYSLGLTIKNLTPVEFTDNARPKLPQMKNVGLGLTFHTEGNAIHFSGEFNDLDGNSGESLARRYRAGVRFLLWQRFGLAVGLYNNKPSYGIKVDAVIVKLGLSYYNQVFGTGDQSFERPEYVFNLAWGI